MPNCHAGLPETLEYLFPASGASRFCQTGRPQSKLGLCETFSGEVVSAIKQADCKLRSPAATGAAMNGHSAASTAASMLSKKTYKLLFFSYAFIGWCIEVTLKFIQFHRFINRGFLTGPWLPIYGSGAVLITIAVKGIAPLESSIGTTFVISLLLCGLLEYLTSYFLEKRFHARWWDYSQKPMNLHGRVWIGNLILFGLGGILIVDLVNPLLARISLSLSLPVREALALSLSAVFLADYVMSHFVLKLVKTGVERSEADNTEAISKEVKLLLSDRSVFHRRFAEAYPEVVYKTERIAARIEKVRSETEKLRQEVEMRTAQMRHEVAENLEPSTSIKNSIIEKQDALIGMIYREETASPEMKNLKRDIESKKAVLQKRRLRIPKL